MFGRAVDRPEIDDVVAHVQIAGADCGRAARSARARRPAAPARGRARVAPAGSPRRPARRRAGTPRAPRCCGSPVRPPPGSGTRRPGCAPPARRPVPRAAPRDSSAARAARAKVRCSAARVRGHGAAKGREHRSWPEYAAEPRGCTMLRRAGALVEWVSGGAGGRRLTPALPHACRSRARTEVAAMPVGNL